MTTTYWYEPDLLQIALGCVYLQAGKAITHFPSSTVGHPSEWVVISRTLSAPLTEKDNGRFPFRVRWDVWQNIVVPLMEGDGQDLWVQFTQSESIPDWGSLIKSWAALLKSQVDPSLAETTINLSTLSSLLGEPIIRGPILTVDSSLAYPAVDPELAWIEGHKRLEYPEVT
jgi:hypothetical protein